MSLSRWLCAACCLVAAPVLGVATAERANNTNKANSQNSAAVVRLQAQFDTADLDHNGFLDKDELAKAFRGAKAKPATQGMYDDEGRLSKVYYQARTKYPEMVYLWSADKNGDELVSWPEFRDYGLSRLRAQQQQQQALQRQMQSAYRRTATQSRRSNRTVYRGRSSTYHHATNHTQYVNHAQQSQQQSMMRAMQNWQNNQVRMQAAYVAAMRQQMQAQQRMVNYVRERQIANYRATMQHAAAAYRAILSRRR